MAAAYNEACPQLMAVAAVTSGDMKAKLARIISPPPAPVSEIKSDCRT
jgi:hypothetical protein